ncbi:MAG TPA: trypsin-like peptidase domain-containing protein [Vicinamibacterales bacterium]|jgi:serine protease Do|nr:trypsin-like peptidase domain-containing protein [Vicinamibacterales bacterium]
MSTRKTTLFYAVLIAVASLAVGMVIASRLDLTPASSAQTMAIPPANSAPITGALSADTFRNIAKAQSPMVVNVTTEMPQKSQDMTDFFGGAGGGGGAPDDFFHRFFGSPGQQQDDQGDTPRGRRGGPQRTPKSYAAGTGFIISKDGLILTNNHVVEGATKIEVQLYAEESDVKYQAKLIGRDQLTDSALIQLVDKPDHALPEAKFGDSAQMAAGDWVMAIGNPFNYAYTVTVGVISATKRAFAVTDGRTNDMLQTDAAINPGNSGGPLLNVRGEVIGINTAIISNGRSEGNIGIGFAVPINTVRDLLPQLRAGKVIRGRIGVSVAAVPREGFEDFGLKARAGAIVATVAPGGAASKAGMEPGDVIVQYNGRPVANRDELVAAVIATKPGTSVPIKVLRNKQDKTLNVTIEELDLEAEQGAARRSPNNSDQNDQAEEGSTGFGLTLQNLTPSIARRLQIPNGKAGALISDVDPNGPAAAVLRAGDVILSVNRQPVTNAADAGRELQKIPSGHIAQILVWRGESEVFVTVKKD